MALMKQNITLAIDNELLKRARTLAVQRGTSVGSLLEDTLQSIVERETEYEQSKRKALAQLSAPFRARRSNCAKPRGIA